MKKNILVNCIKFGFVLYMVVTSLIGAFVIVYIYYPKQKNILTPVPVKLPNNFYFSPSKKNGTQYNNITYEDGVKIVVSDVFRVMTHEDWIYGCCWHMEEMYYFICRYGEDCSQSQSYKDIEFDILLKKYGLPEFSRWKSKSYEKLLREQVKKGIDKGCG